LVSKIDFSLRIFCASVLSFQSSGSSDFWLNSINFSLIFSGSKTPLNQSQ
jgi:hypothetical protein